MKQTLSDLPVLLQQELDNAIYWISSSEIVLQNDAIDLILKHSKTQGYPAIEPIIVDAKFDIESFKNQMEHDGLFQQKKAFKLIALSSIPQNLKDYLYILCQNPISDRLIIIQSNRLTSQQTRAAWFTKILKDITYIPIWPIPPKQWPNFLKTRAKTMYKINLDSKAAQHLAQSSLGNLRFADGELQKWAQNHTTLSHDLVRKLLSDQNQFDVFALPSAILQGDITRCEHILHQLLQDAHQIPVILWAISKMLRDVMALHDASHIDFTKRAKQRGIFSFDQQRDYQAGCRRLTPTQCRHALGIVFELERQFKGVSQQSNTLIHHNLNHCILHLAGLNLPIAPIPSKITVTI